MRHLCQQPLAGRVERHVGLRVAGRHLVDVLQLRLQAQAVIAGRTHRLQELRPVAGERLDPGCETVDGVWMA